MTRAPRSASCRVANGAATACSIATTVIPARGCIIPARLKPRAPPEPSIRPRQPEHVLGHVREDQVRRDRRDLVKPGSRELGLDFEVPAKPEAPVRLDGAV